MGPNKIVILLLAVAVAAGCAGAGVKKTTLKYATVAARDGLALREGPSVKSRAAARVPARTIMAVIDDRGPGDTVAGRTDRWVRVRYGAHSGWVFGGDIIIGEGDDESILSEEPVKEIRYHAEPNGFSDIMLVLGVDGRFSLVIPGYSFGEYEKKSHTAHFKGDWRMTGKTVTIFFDCEKKDDCDFRNLLLDKNGRRYFDYDGVTMASQHEFFFNKNAVRIYILGVSCKKTE